LIKELLLEPQMANRIVEIAVAGAEKLAAEETASREAEQLLKAELAQGGHDDASATQLAGYAELNPMSDAGMVENAAASSNDESPDSESVSEASEAPAE